MTLDSITFRPVYSATGNVKVSDTVRRAISAINRAGRQSISIQDVTYVINHNVFKDEHVTEAQVSRAMGEIARCNRRGERYFDMPKNLVSMDGYFYEYK